VKVCRVLACLLIVFFSSAAFASPPAEETKDLAALFQSIVESKSTTEDIQVFRFGVVDWKGESVTSQGKAPLPSTSPQDRMLAKRGALTDARRNLLCLLYEIRHGLPEKIGSIEIEGEVVDGQVDFQGVKDGVYTVEVTVPLKRFFTESRIARAEVR